MTRPVLFIHGLWLHATSWQPWLDCFAAAGFSAVAPPWPGQARTVGLARDNPDLVAGPGLAETVAHFGAIAAGLPLAPLVVGHSLGALVAARLVQQEVAAAGVCLDADPAQPGLPEPLATLRDLLPALRRPANAGRAISLSAGQFHAGYGAGLDRADSDDLHRRWAVPGPGRPFFEPIRPAFGHTRPLLVVRTAEPPVPVLPAPGTTVHTLSGHGHLLTVARGWQDVAALCLSWLTAP